MSSEPSTPTGPGGSPGRCRRAHGAHILCAGDGEDDLRRFGGGKAKNMWKLSNFGGGCTVPEWFCLSTVAFNAFLKENNIDKMVEEADTSDLEALSKALHARIMSGVIKAPLLEDIGQRLAHLGNERFVAVRSSGADEDSSSHSFAGQFDTLLYQRGLEQVIAAIKQCWSSCFAERVMQHRRDCQMPVTGSGMAVIVQLMINSDVSGVAFSRHPLKPLSVPAVYIEAVHGIGEGLVSGELDPDHYEVAFDESKVSVELANKEEMFRQQEGGGVEKVDVPADQQKARTLTDDQAKEIATIMMNLEKSTGHPQDFEWAIEEGKLYCLQVRPIVTLPPLAFLDRSAAGNAPILWDNSNVVESYSGVTTPLTFSFASRGYTQVYTQTLTVGGVPAEVIAKFKPYLSNMVGLVRGNVYYNLTNWYRALTCLPIIDTAKFMETMMGVKQSLGPELQEIINEIEASKPVYSILQKISIVSNALHKIYSIDTLVVKFFESFNKIYEKALSTDFSMLTLQQQMAFVDMLFTDVLGKWEVPIINDTYVMIFFGLLKKLVARWMVSAVGVDEHKVQSLQNDLLCGQGDVESTEPTKMLMRIAEFVDKSNSDDCDLRGWLLNNPDDVVAQLHTLGASNITETQASGLRRRKGGDAGSAAATKQPTLQELQREVALKIHEFLRRYGFRCINEAKFEEKTLHDDPGFVVDAIGGYVRTHSYSIAAMEEREASIRDTAMEEVHKHLSAPQRLLFNWVLSHARRGVRHRENTRFARSKLYGVFRSVFRAMGENLVRLNMLDERMDVFYLTLPELEDYCYGRAATNNLRGLVTLRRAEFDDYESGLVPPERFMTHGAAGAYMLYPMLLDDLDLLAKQAADHPQEPGVFRGTPCCPGVVEGVLRVVKTIDETKGLNGEILVTARTDPGWVPLYPLCAGLAIERGSLLSHSAVVARELGLPTIVGVSNLMKNLKTGMRVRLDAGKGELRVLDEDPAASAAETNADKATDASAPEKPESDVTDSAIAAGDSKEHKE
ncbi:rifampicin phosphotransferase-like [Sycon ciliatum]|uniref:rifampicin phosphotransferase-like n=1 Tax=Sycon ciliatum TaxID=27933 RepID=UPI0031F63F4F